VHLKVDFVAAKFVCRGTLEFGFLGFGLFVAILLEATLITVKESELCKRKYFLLTFCLFVLFVTVCNQS
jgi:hypothetical protein